MNFGLWLLNFLKDFVGTPALLVGLFSLIGAVAMRKSFSQIIISSFKVSVGFLVLGGGAGVLVSSLNFFQPLFQRVYNLNGVIPNNDAFAGALTESLPSIATLGSLIMVIAMILNIILATFSRLKYVYLSGHVLYYSSLMLAVVMYTSGYDFQNNSSDFAMALIAGSSILAIYMVVSPSVQQKYMFQITGTNEIALGHTGGFGYALSGLIGQGIAKIAKKKPLSTEEIKFPQSLYFFRNTLVSISLTVFLFYIFAFLPAGILYELGKFDKAADAGVISILAQKNWVVTMIISAFTFTAGVEIILFGVRLFIGELVPMFKGFSDKLIKNAKVAVDCPVVFPYAPNAIIIGFISSFFAGIIGFFITLGLGYSALIPAIILPGLVPHFFLGATSGVFGNIKGGIWGAVIGSFVSGLIITFIPVFFGLGNWVPLATNELGNLIKGTNKQSLITLNWGDTDYFIGYIPGILGLIPKAGKYIILGLSLFVYFVFIIDGIIKKHFKNRAKPA